MNKTKAPWEWDQDTLQVYSGKCVVACDVVADVAPLVVAAPELLSHVKSLCVPEPIDKTPEWYVAREAREVEIRALIARIEKWKP